jgi:hypothetical protein
MLFRRRRRDRARGARRAGDALPLQTCNGWTAQAKLSADRGRLEVKGSTPAGKPFIAFQGSRAKK